MKKNLLLVFTIFVTSIFSASGQSGANDSTFNPTDHGFNTGAGFDAEVYATLLQPDGKIIVGGYYGYYNGVFQDPLGIFFLIRFDNMFLKDNLPDTIDTKLKESDKTDIAAYAAIHKKRGKCAMSISLVSGNRWGHC